MKLSRQLLILRLVILFSLIGNVGWGQVSITSTTTVTENFSGLLTLPTAILPTGFKIGTDWSTGTTACTLAYGSTGTGAVTSTSTGGAINWANGITTSSTDRALGFLNSGSYSSPKSIVYAFTNNTGATVTSLQLSWNYEKYRSGTRQFAWTFFHGNTSTALTSETQGDQTYAADAANTNVYNPPTQTNKTFTISGLSIANGTTYYLRWTFTGLGGSTNGQGIGIDDFSITLVYASVASVPTLTIPTSSSITTSSATLGATITNDGGSTITERGTVYGTTASPTINTLAEGGTTVSSFTNSRTGLTPNTFYYFRGYAINGIGIGYSPDGTFTTIHNAPTIGTCNTPTTTGFTASWSAPTGGGSANFGYEIQVSTDNTFATGVTTFNISSSASPVTSVACTGLSSGTTYYFRVRAVNAGGNSAWSSVSSGCTTSLAPPTVTTTTVSSISNTGAACGGNVTFSGGTSATVTDRGVVFNSSINPPSYADAGSIVVSSGSGTGVFSGTVSGLSPQTLYYYRAYATNTPGVYGYGAANNFYTLSSPVVATAANLFANAFSSSQIDLSWDAANWPTSGAAVKGYVLVRNTGSTPVFTAVNGTAPASCVTTGTLVSSTIGESSTSFSNTSLSQSTTYYFLLIPFTWDGTNAATCNYSTPISAYASTPLGPCTPPVTQVTSAVVSSPTINSLTLSWTAGSGDRTLVIVRQGSPVNVIPVSGTSYAANAAFSAGDNLGGGNFVCYLGTSNTFTLSNLSASTTYYFAVYTLNNSGYCFNLTSPATTNGITSLSASVIETFEPSTKVAYAVNNVTGALGTWVFDNALIGSSAQDRFIGTKSARIQSTGSITSLFDKANGLGIVRLNHALFGTDPSTTWKLYVSDDGGATFSAFQSTTQTTNSTTLTTTSFTVNVTGNNIRIRISKLSGGTNSRLNIDDISLTDYVSTNTITTGAISGSPFCVTTSTGNSISVPFTAVGVYNTGNVYTAQLSDASGSFASPVEIGNITSVSASGVIPCVIPAGTLTGSGYRVRIVSSDPLITGSTSSSALSIFLNVIDVDNLNAGTASTQVTLNWINPLSCFNDVLVVASTSPITCVPTGDGSNYTANSVYSLGSTCNGSYAVYKGTGTSVTVTGLTNDTIYYFIVFVRNGTQWSPGVSISAVPNDFLIGDYRSRAGTHFYNGTDNTTWEVYAGSGVWNSTNTFPNGDGKNVYITNGSIIQLSTSYGTSPINNLTVDQGGIIRSTSPTNAYLTIYGNIVCNGTIGNGSTSNTICFNMEGTNSTISGSPTGNFDANRIRKNYFVKRTSNLIIAKDLNLRWSTSSGTSLYNAAVNTNFNVTINANTIVSVILDPLAAAGTSGSVCIDGTYGLDFPSNTEKGGTFTVNGTLNVPGILYATTDNVNTSFPCKWVIGSTGVINCNQVNCNASGAATHTIQILDGGKLNMNTNIGFNYTVFSTTNNVFDLQPGSIVEYSAPSGISSILTNLTYSNLLLSGGGTRDMINNLGSSTGLTLTVNKNLSITGSTTLDPVANNINVGGNWSNYGTIGFAEGTSNVTFTGFSGAQKIVCPGGEAFYNMLVTNNTTSGVELNDDVEVKNDLTLGSIGRLFFGVSPNTLRLSKMSASSSSLIGTAGSLIDMSSSASTMIIGSENMDFSGTLNPGTTSFVNYNRDLNITSSGGSGNQNINTNLTYANLSFSGTNTKNVNSNFTVNGSMTIDGPTTSLEANLPNIALTLGGDLILSGDATMGGSTGASCLNNFNITTTGNAVQNFDAGFQSINCYNLTTNKTSNGIVLRADNTNMAVNNFLTQTTAATFTPNNNRVKIGGGWNIWGTVGFNKGTSTIEYNGLSSENIIAVNYHNLESSNSGNRIMANSGSIGIENNFLPGTNSYTFTGSTIDYNGALSQNIASFTANNTTGKTYNNIVLSNAGIKSLAGAVDVEGILTLKNNVTLALGDQDLTLKSTISRTASVDKITTSNGISYGNGRFVVERYIPTGSGAGQHGKSWQFLAIPTTGQTIKEAWQEGASTPNGNPRPGYGTQITSNLGGNYAGAVALGFDTISSAGPSMKVYNNSTGLWEGVISTNIPINNSKGYMVFVRGDRSATTYNATPTSTTLRTKGKIFEPAIPPTPININAGDTLISIGNPYASAIDFSMFDYSFAGGAKQAFWVWDPLKYSSLGYGGYQYIAATNINTNGDDFIPLPGGTTNYPPNVSCRTIQSGQAFFLPNSGASGYIGFTEDIKISGSRTTFRTPSIPTTPDQYLKTLLYIGSGSSAIITDGALVKFNDTYDNSYDENDATKFFSPGENLGITRDGKTLIVEARKTPNINDTVFLSLSNLRRRTYEFRFSPTNIRMTGVAGIYLYDRYLGTSSVINNNDSTVVDFVVNTDSLSYATNRFYIVFARKVINHPIPILPNPKAETAKPVVKITDENSKASNVYIAPNPVTNKKLNLFTDNLKQGTYKLLISDAIGRLVFNKEVFINTANQKLVIDIDKTLPSGIYNLDISGHAVSKNIQFKLR